MLQGAPGWALLRRASASLSTMSFPFVPQRCYAHPLFPGVLGGHLAMSRSSSCPPGPPLPVPCTVRIMAAYTLELRKLEANGPLLPAPHLKGVLAAVTTLVPFPLSKQKWGPCAVLWGWLPELLLLPDRTVSDTSSDSVVRRASASRGAVPVALGLHRAVSHLLDLLHILHHP